MPSSTRRTESAGNADDPRGDDDKPGRPEPGRPEPGRPEPRRSGSRRSRRPVRGLGLPRTARLRTVRDFRRVYGRGARARGRALVIVALRRRAPGHRLGLSVSKEHGGAVRRNKIKRMFREAFRLERANLPGQFDLILIPQKRTSKYPLDELRLELLRLVQKVHAGESRGPGRDRRRRGRP